MTTGPAGWHPVALSVGVEPGTANGTRLSGRELVTWRDSAGAVHVWDDRCPHRGMRLSFGFVRGGTIACLYHGWRYDAEGRCLHIPAHPQLTPPDTIRVPGHEVTERLGMVWTRVRGASGIDLPEERPVTAVRSITVERRADEVIAHAMREDGRSVALLTPALLLFWTGEQHVLAGVQALSAGECALHVVVAGDHGTAMRKATSMWAERLRDTVETARAVG